MPFNPIAPAPDFSPANPIPDLTFPGSFIAQAARDANPPFTGYYAIMGWDTITSQVYSMVFNDAGQFIGSNVVLNAGAGAGVNFSFAAVNTNTGWQIGQRYITLGDASTSAVQVNVSGVATGPSQDDPLFLSGISTYTGGFYAAQLNPDDAYMPGAVNFSAGIIDNSGPTHFWISDPPKLVLDGIMFATGQHYTISTARLGPDPAAPFNYISPIAIVFPPNLGLVLCDVQFSNGPFGAGPLDGAYCASFEGSGGASSFIKFADEAVTNGNPILLNDPADNRRVIIIYNSVLVSTGLIMQAIRNTGSGGIVNPDVSAPYGVSIGFAPSMTISSASMSPDGFIYLLGTSNWVIVYDRNFNFVDEVDLNPYLSDYVYAPIALAAGLPNGKGFSLFIIDGVGQWGLWNWVYNPNNPGSLLDPSGFQAVDLGPCMPCFPVLIRDGGWAPPIGYKFPTTS